MLSFVVYLIIYFFSGNNIIKKALNSYLNFLNYSEKYDEKIKGISTKNHKQIRERVNNIYFKSGAEEI